MKRRRRVSLDQRSFHVACLCPIIELIEGFLSFFIPLAACRSIFHHATERLVQTLLLAMSLFWKRKRKPWQQNNRQGSEYMRRFVLPVNRHTNQREYLRHDFR